jgi:hypothetical protein
MGLYLCYIEDGEIVGNIYGNAKALVNLTKTSFGGNKVRDFEFDSKYDFYALVAVNEGEWFNPLEKAFEMYIETGAYENVEQAKAKGMPDELTEEQALVEYLVIVARCDLEEEPEEIYKQFFTHDNAILLSDGNL